MGDIILDILIYLLLTILSLGLVAMIWVLIMLVIEGLGDKYLTRMTFKLWGWGIGTKQEHGHTYYYRYFVVLFGQFEGKDRNILLLDIRGPSYLKPKTKKIPKLIKKGWMK